VSEVSTSLVLRQVITKKRALVDFEEDRALNENQRHVVLCPIASLRRIITLFVPWRADILIMNKGQMSQAMLAARIGNRPTAQQKQKLDTYPRGFTQPKTTPSRQGSAGEAAAVAAEAVRVPTGHSTIHHN
jgi:hypothetical protein